MKGIVKQMFVLDASEDMFTQCCQSTHHWFQSLGNLKNEC